MRHPVVNSLFGLTTVSLAAQLGTAPLVAYYFSRFATYFLLVNIVIVPMAMLIIYASLVTLMVPVAGGVLLWLVGALNTILGWVADMPMASIGDLHPSMLQVALMYVVVGAVYGLLTISLRSRDYT